MHETLIDIALVVFIVYAVFSIATTISVGRTSAVLRGLLKTTGKDLRGAVVELRETLQNANKISTDVGSATEEIRAAADRARSLEKAVRDLYDYLKDGVGVKAAANVAGLTAGVKVGVATLMKTLREERREHHEKESHV